jgi:ribosome-binding protein aMBF1 (putative translation factor)
MAKADSKFGTMVAVRRRKAGWTLRQLSQMSQIPLATIHAIENGTTETRLQWVEKLAKVFGENWLPWQHN